MARRDPETRLSELVYVMSSGKDVDMREVFEAFRGTMSKPMIVAIQTNRKDVVIKLLAHGSVDMWEGAMVEACKSANIEVVETLIEANVPVGMDAVEAALKTGDPELLKIVHRGAEATSTPWLDKLSVKVANECKCMVASAVKLLYG